MRKRVVRFQLLVLGVLAILVIGRFYKGLPSLEGELTILDIGSGDLKHQGFSVDRATPVEITAYGSLVREMSNPVPTDLAAYPWIVRRADRSLVWRMDPSRGEVLKGTLIKVNDTVRVAAGSYDLYFASYGPDRSGHFGNPLLRLTGHWTGDRKNWQVALRARGEANLKADNMTVENIQPVGKELVIWSSGPMGGRQTSEQLFEVQSPTPLSVYSIGEICNGDPCDTGWISNLATGEVAWKLSEDNSVLAGGSKSNRVFNGLVSLEPGSYRAAYKTDAGHSFGNWYGNPPFDPAGWGLTISATDASDKENVKLFDLWGERTAFVSMIRVREDEDRATPFRVTREVPIVAYAMGELRSSGSSYDYGWIEDDQGNTLWQMSWGGSSPAGGDSDNRLEQSFLILKPGRYTAHYVSDGSHSFDDWNRARPNNPERWGMTLFLLNDDDEDAVTVERLGAAPSSPAEPSPVDGSILVELVRVGNDAHLAEDLIVDEGTRLRIQALGEITVSDRYDYGWIENEKGEIVWSMDRSNTAPTAEAERLRRFDGIVTLDPGRYVVRFKSDFSYAFGDFDGENPARPQDYGIRIFRVNGDEDR